MRPNCEYIILITTNCYAGHFEKDLTAYITGHTGECTTGIEAAEDFRKNVEDDTLFSELAFREDDEGYSMPCAVWRNNSIAIFFDEKPLPAEIAVMRQRIGMYNQYREDSAQDPINIKFYELSLVETKQYTQIKKWDLDG